MTARPSRRTVFLLTSYNQQAFIAEAVEAALAQDFTPLEIVISDDCSPDGTFDIIEALVAAYVGPHEVRINRNPVRLGSVSHMASIVETIGDAFIVMAHGDDVSYPHRTRMLVEACERHCVSMVSSGAKWIGSNLSKDAGDRPSRHVSGEEMVRAYWLPEMLGAALACDSAVFSRFDRLSGQTLACGLDHVLPLRAAALRGFYYLSDHLIGYRRHDANMSNTISDRTGTDLVFHEGMSAYNLAIRAFQRADISSHIAAHRLAWRSRRLLRTLDRKIVSDTIAWSVHRAGLSGEGLLPTWRPAEEIRMRKRAIEVSF